VYGLSLPAGRYEIIVSYLGYRSDTTVVDLPRDIPHNVALVPIAIPFPEIVVSGEDPAHEIMRNVIARKQEWFDALLSFMGKAYTRTAIRTDTSMAMIAESYSTIYWAKGDSLREVITQQRQSATVPSTLPLAYVRAVLNFYEDRIDLGGCVFVGPTAADAFSYYNFKLTTVRYQDNVPIYDIEITPKSRLTPLFRGRISIDGKTYRMIEVDVEPNEAFVLPLVKSTAIRFRQQFRLYDDKYSLPADYHLDVMTHVSLVVASGKVGFAKSVVLYDYAINSDLTDSLRLLPALSFHPRASVFDSTFWAQTNVLPLTGEEQLAYIRLDSIAAERARRPRSSVSRFLRFLCPMGETC
jgi:hypothetical protein